MSFTVALTHDIDARARQRLLDHGARIALADAPNAQAIEACCAGSDAIIVRAQLPDGLFERHPRLRAAVRHGVGVDFIPLPEATRCGVAVANVPGANAQSVAEHALAALLLLARRTHDIAATLHEGDWNAARGLALQGRELAGSTLGLVGYGNVGRRLAAICRNGLGMRVLACAPGYGTDDGTAEPATLAQIQAASDYLVLACPLTDQTHGLVDAAFLAGMRPGACLVNVARGPVVDEAALAHALRSGVLSGAAVDVYHRHPLDAASPLWGLEGLLATPHCAGITASSMRAMGLGAVDEVLRTLRGEPPRSFVNPQAWALHRERHRPLSFTLQSS